MAMTDLTNQRQVFVEEYVRSGDHLDAAKKAGLVPDPKYQARFPNEELATISINLFKAVN